MSIESSIQLPEDVLIDILSRIPAKSLLQFKSVSKHWYSLLQNPYFISLHHSRAQPYDCISTAPNLNLDDTFESSMYLLPNQTSIQLLDLSFTIKDAYVFASCNGLMCLFDYSGIVICNPAIREFRVLPQPPYESRRTMILGFGFDPKSNDYKVLRVATLNEFDLKTPDDRLYDDPLEWLPVDHKIQIYGMSTDSWKEIVAMVPNNYPRFPSDCPFPCISLDGVFYWLGSDVATQIQFVHKFRMFEELFERIPFPDAFFNQIVDELYILKNSLAVVLREFDHEPSAMTRFHVWVMDEYQVMESWTKKYTVGPPLGSYHPLGFRPNVEVLLMRRFPSNIVSYNLSSGDINEYNQLCGRPGAGYVTRVLAYSENIFSVKIRVF